MSSNTLLKQLSEYEEGPRYVHLKPDVENHLEVLSRPTDQGTSHPTIFEMMVRIRENGEGAPVEGKWSVSSKRLAHDLVTHLGTDDAKWVGARVAISYTGDGYDRVWTVRRLSK